MIKVQILMSTYNGEKYLREQLDSILSQKTKLGKKRISFSLLIRDDGSTDSTGKILEEYADKFPGITYFQEENIGACRSFFRLLQKADHNMDYIAFSDQDDVWNENKLRRAVRGLKKYQAIPAMYAGDMEIVDHHLNLLKVSSNVTKRFRPSFGNALVENICTGATIVINHVLYRFIAEKIPKRAYMHDWWLYMAASCFGKVLYDRKPYMKYRQHEENTVGSAVGYGQLIKKRIENFQSLQQYVPEQIAEFLKLFELPEDKKKLAEVMLIEKGRYLKRMKIFDCREIRRRRPMDTVCYKIMYLFWK